MTCDGLGRANVVMVSVGCGCEGPRASGCAFVNGLDNARRTVTLALRWNWVMRVCTFDSAFKCRTREGTEISPVLATLAGISLEFPFNRLASVTATCGEANAGGDA